MQKKIINWREELIKLFPDVTEKTLLDNHKWCDECNGLGLVRTGDEIGFCAKCDGFGQIKLCPGCGKEVYTYLASYCKECQHKQRELEQKREEEERFNKANKIQYKDYNGVFIVPGIYHVMDKCDFEDYLYERIERGQEAPKYVYATRKVKVLKNIDITEIIVDICDQNGYEDMASYLDLASLDPVQKALDEWIEKQEKWNYYFEEDYNTVVLLDDLIGQLKQRVESQKEC